MSDITPPDTDMEPIPPMPAPKGVPGASLLRFAGMIPADDLEKMARAIEEDCENICLSEEELRAGIRAFSREWEDELDDYKPDEM